MKHSLDRSKKYFIFVRHFSTKWNKENKLQGKKDIGIEKINKRQIQKEKKKIFLLTEKLKIKDTNIYTSKLKRSKQTAIKLGYKNFIEESLLNEYDMGKFEGMKKTKFFSKFIFNFKFYKIYKNEKKEKIINRIKKFIKKAKEGKLNICIAHGMWIRFLYILLHNKSANYLFKINVANGSKTILVFKNFNQFQLKLNQ